MPTLNASLPEHLYCLVRREFLHNLEGDHGEFSEAVLLGVTSVPSRAMGFTVLLEDGSQFARLPIHALVTRSDAPLLDVAALQAWDCFGYEFAVTCFDYLREMGCVAHLPGGVAESATYICMFDWYDNGWSDEPSQHKTLHLLALDNGCFALQPNNRIQWIDRSFTSPWRQRPSYLTNTHRWHAEERSEVPPEDRRRYFYGLEVAAPI